MVGTFVRAGVQSIKGVKPFKKFKGQMTVSEAKLKASKAGLDAAKFDLKQTIKNFGKKKKK
tara:strand:+ start:259 stop:441 length:183 start_codon:yes stop_codon:yes gene_type:complete